MSRSASSGDVSARRRRWVSTAGLTIFGASLAIGTIVGMTAGMKTAEPVFGLGIVVFAFVALGLGWRAATHPGLDARARSAWRWIGASYLLLAVATVLFVAGPWVTFPRPGDLVKLAMAVVLTVGILRLPMPPMDRNRRLRLLFDAGTVASAVSLFLWFLVIAPVIGGGQATAARLAAAAAYPLVDVGLVFVAAVVLMRGAGSPARRTMRLLVAASALWVVGDTIMSYRYIDPSHPVTIGWEALPLFASHFLLCAATWEQIGVAGAGTDVDRHPTWVRPVSKLPYAAIAAAFVVLTVAASRPPFRLPWLGLVLCMAALTGCVVARQVIAQRENLRMAVTDGLTGLVNRVGLHEGLSLALARGARSGETTAVLLADLDGFKTINDTLGHEAGDLLLVAFARALRRSVLGADVVGRLGGDEFAVVLRNVGNRDNADAIVRRLHKELEQPVMTGDVVVTIRCSVGIALSEPGEMTLDQIMHQADLDMYDVKRARKPWQATEAAPGRLGTSSGGAEGA